MPPKKPAPDRKPPVLEWIMGGLGLLLTLAVLAVIGGGAVGPRQPARLEARLGEVRPAGAVWLAEVEVRNLGDDTARATIDYVPAHGEERVTLAFPADPRAAEVSVSGWSEP